MTTLPPVGTVYDEVLAGYFGDRTTLVQIEPEQGATIPYDTSLVYNDSLRSDLWTNYLKSVGIDSADPNLANILFSTVYTDHKSPNNTIVWRHFLADQSLPSSLDPDDTSVGSYYWYEYLKSQGIPLDHQPTPADLTAFGIYATAKKAQIIANFVAFATAYQTTLQVNFVGYLNARLVDLQTQELNLASPDEVKKREIMFKTFEILLKMLVALQDTVRVVGQNLIFFGKWQEQYTKMLTRVPIYTGGTSSDVQVPDLTVPNPNFEGFTLGYNNISMQDVANWYATKITNGETGTFYISSAETLEIDAEGQQLHTRTAIKIDVSDNPLDPLGGTTFSIVQQIIRKGDGDNNDPYVYDSNGEIIELGRFDIGNDQIFESTADSSIRALNDQVIFRIPPGSTLNDDFQAQNELFKRAFIDFYNSIPTQSVLSGASPSSTDFYIPDLYVRDETGQLVALGGWPGSDHNRFLHQVPIFIKDPVVGTNPLPAWRVMMYEGGILTPPYINTNAGENNDGVIGTLNIPWTNTFNITEGPGADKDRADQESKARGELNARNQQYIENIRSKRQIVQNNAKQIESGLSQAKESISQMANLLTSIMDSLKGLIAAIYR